MKRFKFFILVLLLTALACYVPARSYRGLSIAMISPHTSTYIWPLGQEMTLEALGVIDGGGATHITFYASGRVIGSSPVDSSDDKPHGVISWTPTAAGEYFVQAEMYPPSGASAMSSPVRVCILDIGSSPSDPVWLWGYGYSGPCTVPAEVPVPTGTSTDVNISAMASPVSLGYDSNDCSASVPPATITFNATVDDPSGRAAFVTVRMSSSSAGTAPYFDSLFLAQTGGGPTGTRTFSGTTFDMSIPLNDALSGGPGTLTWIARAIDRTGHMIAMDGPHDMMVGPCEPPVHPLTIESPTPTLITILPTETPQGLCPPGTYYAPATNRCIPVQILPTKKCSAFTTDTSCNAQTNCTYNYTLKKCESK